MVTLLNVFVSRSVMSPSFRSAHRVARCIVVLASTSPSTLRWRRLHLVAERQAGQLIQLHLVVRFLSTKNATRSSGDALFAKTSPLISGRNPVLLNTVSATFDVNFA
jgi:hypothetical protein